MPVFECNRCRPACFFFSDEDVHPKACPHLDNEKESMVEWKRIA